MKYDFYSLFMPTAKDYDERDKKYKRFCKKYGFKYEPCRRDPLYEERVLPDGTKIRKKVTRNENEDN